MAKKDTPKEEISDKERIESLEKELKAMRDDMASALLRLEDVPTKEQMGFEMPITRIETDKYFKHQRDGINFTLQLNTDQMKKDMAAGGGGGGGGFATGEYEQTYVNSTGCIDDVDDPNCGIPFDVTYRDKISIIDNVLTRELQNAFAQFKVECKFMRCTDSSSEESAALDRWRPCGVEDDSEDIFLDQAIFDMLPAEMVEPIILPSSPNKCFAFVESGVEGEVATDPAPFIYIYDGCESAECPYPPCSATCQKAQPTVVATIDSSSLPGGCSASWEPLFGDGPYTGGTFGPGVNPSWTWTNAEPVPTGATLSLRCVGDVIEARLISVFGAIIFGDPTNGPTFFKDITSSITCSGSGKLSGTFTLSVLNSSFCSGGAPGSYDTVTVTLA